MKYAEKLSEIESCIGGNLTLFSKSRKVLEHVPEYFYVGSVDDNETAASPGVELIYKGTTQEILAVYSVLIYKKNVAGKRYPYDLVVAADFVPGRIGEVVEDILKDKEKNESRILFSDQLQGPYKKSRFDDISNLREGSTLKDLATHLDRTFFGFFL